MLDTSFPWDIDYHKRINKNRNVDESKWGVPQIVKIVTASASIILSSTLPAWADTRLCENNALIQDDISTAVCRRENYIVSNDHSFLDFLRVKDTIWEMYNSSDPAQRDRLVITLETWETFEQLESIYRRFYEATWVSIPPIESVAFLQAFSYVREWNITQANRVLHHILINSGSPYVLMQIIREEYGMLA